MPYFTGADLYALITGRGKETIDTVLVGFREYIFSEAAGALGKFAAATEYAFGTIGQRIMTYPGR